MLFNPDMGQIISSSKLFRNSFSIPLGDSFCFPLCLLGDDPQVGGEDIWCTTFVDPEIGKESSLLSSAWEFGRFTPSWELFVEG